MCQHYEAVSDLLVLLSGIVNACSCFTTLRVCGKIQLRNCKTWCTRVLASEQKLECGAISNFHVSLSLSFLPCVKENKADKQNERSRREKQLLHALIQIFLGKDFGVKPTFFRFPQNKFVDILDSYETSAL